MRNFFQVLWIILLTLLIFAIWLAPVILAIIVGNWLVLFLYIVWPVPAWTMMIFVISLFSIFADSVDL